MDGSGDLFIADTDNCVIREVNAATHVIPRSAGNGTPDYSGDNGPATAAELRCPSDIAVDSSGDLFVADCLNSVIREVDPYSHVITTVAGSEYGAGYSGNGGLATAAKLDGPGKIALDGNGDLFIADTSNSEIREVLLDSDVVVTPATLTVKANNATRTYGAVDPLFGAATAGSSSGRR